MKVYFRSLEYQNFMSVGNIPIKIDLTSHKTTLISGLNGSGKTTVISALCFGLFGKGYTDLNKPALVNSINQKQLLVTVEFDIGTKKYKIVRGIKPNIFNIFENDVLINQDPSVKDYQKTLEQQILGFNFRAFTQVVVVGGGDNYTPFMKLSTKDRREFVEDLLDIRVFSTMNALVKDVVKDLKESAKTVTMKMSAVKEKMVLQDSFIKKLKRDKESSSDKISDEIEKIQAENKILSTDLDLLTKELHELKPKVDMLSELEDQISELKSNARLIYKQISSKQSELDSYAEMTSCPTCFQEICDNHKDGVLLKYETELKQCSDGIMSIGERESELKSLMQTYEESLSKYSHIQSKISKINQETYSNNSMLRQSISRLSDLTNDTSNIDDEIVKLKEFAKSYVECEIISKKILEDQQYQDLIQQILSDSGIKSRIIRQYVPSINKSINKYLNDLDFFVSFHLDEQFNETIKSRHRDTFSYNNFSEGQKRRIDLAILLTWVEISKAKNSLHTNVMFLDELDSPLDAEGSDMLHSAMKACSSENVFIISHKSDRLIDKVDNVIKFRIHNNFTEVVDI